MINRYQIGNLIFDSTGTRAEAMSGSEILDEIEHWCTGSILVLNYWVLVQAKGENPTQ